METRLQKIRNISTSNQQVDEQAVQDSLALVDAVTNLGVKAREYELVTPYMRSSSSEHLELDQVKAIASR